MLPRTTWNAKTGGKSAHQKPEERRNARPTTVRRPSTSQQRTGEPLTGRKLTLLLLPLAQLEQREVETAHETRAHLEMRLIRGS